MEGLADLFEVVNAFDPLGLPLGLGQSRQQDRRQNPDDGNHHQEFD